MLGWTELQPLLARAGLGAARVKTGASGGLVVFLQVTLMRL